MPCLNISTNVCLDGVYTDPIFAESTKAVAQVFGRSEQFVMVLLKGSVDIQFEMNKEPAVYAEIVSMGGINSEVKKKLLDRLGSIVEKYLSVPRTRFFLKFFDTTLGKNLSKL